MRILITGKGGKAGSWACRAVQLGDALGATVKPFATAKDIRKHDITILVKRTPADTVKALQDSGRPWVYDIVDAWPQPAGNQWGATQAAQWLRDHVRRLRPTACAYVTKRQQQDAGYPGEIIPHHARSGQTVNPIRQHAINVGYEGREQYILPVIRQLRATVDGMAMRLHINPRELADMDILLAVRFGQWRGYAPTNWKSHVKLANAHATGTPIICGRESSYIEFAASGEVYADDLDGIRTGLGLLRDYGHRKNIHRRFLDASRQWGVNVIARQYRQWLESLIG